MGCGTGEPISGYIIGRGFDLTGIDSAPAMIAIAQTRYPDAVWTVADMRALPDVGKFHGILSWHGFFHLSADEQRKALPEILSHMHAGGAIMLTVGPEAGEVTGTVAGEAVYHASLSSEEYEAILTGAGFTDVSFAPSYPACSRSSVILATGFAG